MTDYGSGVTGDSPGFGAGKSGKLGRAQLGERGVTVRVQGSTLLLVGDRGGRLAISFGFIRRVRISRMPNTKPTRRRYYRMSVWKVGEEDSLTLWPDWEDKEAFHEVVRALAAGVVTARGKDALESGIGWGAAFRSSIWLFVALAVVGHLADAELQWHHSLQTRLLALAGLATGVALSTWFDRDRPRTLDHPAGLEAILAY